MGAKRRLAKAELGDRRRERMADPDVGAGRMLREGDSIGRVIVKAIRNRRARRAGRTR